MATQGIDPEHYEARLATDIGIRAGKCQRIFEDGYCISEVNAVLVQVGTTLGGIPLERDDGLYAQLCTGARVEVWWPDDWVEPRAEADDAWPRKGNERLGLERPGGGCASARARGQASLVTVA